MGVIAFHPAWARGWRAKAARKMGGVSVSPSMASIRLSAIFFGAYLSGDAGFGLIDELANALSLRRAQPLEPAAEAAITVQCRSSSGGWVKLRFSRSGSS